MKPATSSDFHRSHARASYVGEVSKVINAQPTSPILA